MLDRFKISLWPSVVTLTAFVLLCKLGFWQLDRAEEKRLWLNSFDNLQPLPIEQLQSVIDNSDLPSINGRQLTIRGEVQAQFMAYLDNRVYQGQTGYKVLAPVKVSGISQWLMVDFGWVKGPKMRTDLPSVALPKTIMVEGLIKSTNLQQFVLATSPIGNEWPQRVQAIEQLLTHTWPAKLLPAVVYVNDGQISDFTQTYQPVVMQPEKHQAYAVQWFLLALASVAVFLFASRVKPAAQKET